MHFDQFFRLAIHINVKISRLRHSLLQQRFSLYSLYLDIKSHTPASNPPLNPPSPTSHCLFSYIYPKQPQPDPQSLHSLNHLFNVQPNQQIPLTHLLALLNGDSTFQLSLYNDCPVTAKIRRKFALLVRLEMLFQETLEKFKRYLRGKQGGADMVVKSFHAIDQDRNYFVNCQNLKRFVGGGYSNGEVEQLLGKLWRVTAVPFLDYFQLFTQNTERIVRKQEERRSNSKKTTTTQIASRVKSQQRKQYSQRKRSPQSLSTAKRSTSSHKPQFRTLHT